LIDQEVILWPGSAADRLSVYGDPSLTLAAPALEGTLLGRRRRLRIEVAHDTEVAHEVVDASAEKRAPLRKVA